MKLTSNSLLGRSCLFLLLASALLCHSVTQGMHTAEPDSTTADKTSADTKTKSDDTTKTDKADTPKDTNIKPDHDSIEFKMNFFESPVLEVTFCGTHQQDLLALTSDGMIYISEDHGFKWDNKTKELMKLNGGPQVITQVLQNPIDLNVVLLMGDNGQNYITSDCGVTIKKLNSAKPFHQFQFHPLNKDWMLAATWTACAEDDDPDDCSRFKELHLTKDMGESWTFIEEYVLQFSWGMEGIWQAFAIPDNRIVISHITKKEGHQIPDKWIEKAEIAMSDDFFKTKQVLVPGGNKFLITEHFILVVQVVDEKDEEIKLLVSDSRQNHYSFNPIELPNQKKKLKEHSYFLLDHGQDRIYLHINHEGSGSKFGTLYISDSTGHRFTTALKNHVKSPIGDADFTRVEGLNGIYFANVYNAAAVKLARKEGWTGVDDEIPVEKGSSKPRGRSKFGTAASTNDAEKEGKKSKDLDHHINSLISFNRGSTWQKLTPPLKDADRNPIECEGECSLNLVGLSQGEFAPPYSSENSLGIILAVGNVGESLSTKSDELNTYFSRDGGLNWYEIIKGPHIYEIGNHGALIVVAPHQKATKTIYYTWNEGLDWQRLPISDTPIEISNIIIEPNNTSQKFLVLGTTTIASEKGNISVRKGLTVVVDFSTLHERVCEGYFEAFTNTEGTDYELFTPNGKISPNCLLGVKATYVRRRRDAQCFNPEMYEFMSNYATCECTEEDWECDYGYERDSGNQCVRVKGQALEEVKPPEDCKDYYTISRGYRKVAGDYCQGGVDHSGVKMMCPRKMITRSTIMAALIIVIGVLVWYAFGPKLKEYLASRSSKKPGSQSKGGYQRPMKDFPNNLADDDDNEHRIKFDEGGSSKRPANNASSPVERNMFKDDDD